MPNQARMDDGREAADETLDQYLRPLNMATTEQQDALTEQLLRDNEANANPKRRPKEMTPSELH